MKYLKYAALAVALGAPVFAQDQGGWRKAGQAVEQKGPAQQDLTDAQVQDIITKFAAKETEFARARENYTYRQTARVQELEPDGVATGKWEMVTDVIFSPDGNQRTERVVRAPMATLKRIQLTPEDEADLRNVQPFVLTTDEIPKYYIRYLGKQNVDEIPCFVFAVKPKKLEKGQRYFEGQIWVDDRDLQIVKSYGRGVGIVRGDNQFPKFETYREQIDGKYWFPTYTRADDVLNFQSGPQRIRMLVRYENYKQFKGESTIKYGDVVDQPKQPEQQKPPANAPTKP